MRDIHIPSILIMIFIVVIFSGTRLSASEVEKYVRAAELYLLDDKIQAAEKEIEKALKADPGYAPAHDLAGFIAETKGDQSAAETSYRKALESDPKFHEARLHLGELYTAMDRFDDAVNELEILKKEKPDLVAAYAALGRVRILKEEYKLAEKVLMECKKNAEESAEIEFLLGTAYLGLGQSSFKDAVTAFKESIRIDNDYTDAYVALADVYMEEGNYPRAAEQLVTALRIEPDHTEANYLFGRLAVLRKQYPKALVAFKKTLELDGNNLDAHREIGLIYQDYKKDFSKAVFHYNKYKSLGGTDSRVEEWLEKAKKSELSGTSDNEIPDEEKESGENSEDKGKKDNKANEDDQEEDEEE